MFTALLSRWRWLAAVFVAAVLFCASQPASAHGSHDHGRHDHGPRANTSGVTATPMVAHAADADRAADLSAAEPDIGGKPLPSPQPTCPACAGHAAALARPDAEGGTVEPCATRLRFALGDEGGPNRAADGVRRPPRPRPV